MATARISHKTMSPHEAARVMWERYGPSAGRIARDRESAAESEALSLFYAEVEDVLRRETFPPWKKPARKKRPKRPKAAAPTAADFPVEEVHAVGTALVRAQAVYGSPGDKIPQFYDLWLLKEDGTEVLLNDGYPWYTSLMPGQPLGTRAAPTAARIEVEVVMNELYDDHPELESLRL